MGAESMPCKLSLRAGWLIAGDRSERSNRRELDPPGVKAIVVVLATDLSFAELEENRDMRSEFRVGGKTIDRDGEQSAPVNLECDVLSVDNRIQDVEPLCTYHLLSFARGDEQRVEIAMLPDRRQPVGEFLLHYITGKVFRQRSTLGAILQRFEVAACDCEIVGRSERHAFPRATVTRAAVRLTEQSFGTSQIRFRTQSMVADYG